MRCYLVSSNFAITSPLNKEIQLMIREKFVKRTDRTYFTRPILGGKVQDTAWFELTRDKKVGKIGFPKMEV